MITSAANERIIEAESEAEDEEEMYIGYDDISDSETEDSDNLQYVKDMQRYMNVLAPVINALNQTAGSGDEESTLQNIRRAIHTQTEELEPIHDTGSTPFNSMSTFVLHALFLGDDRLCSEEKIKKIMLCMQILFELKEANPNLKLPSLDALLNFQNKV